MRLATILQAQMRTAGVELEIRSLDWGTFFDDVKHGKFQLYGLTWVGIRTPEIYRLAFHSQSVPPLGANRGLWVAMKGLELIEVRENEGGTGMVEFDFSIGDPELYVEMILPEQAFLEFCVTNSVRFLTEEEGAAIDADREKWRTGEHTGGDSDDASS